MNYAHWLIRMRRWVANPPSMGRVKLVVGVVALCVALVAIEKLIGWPDFLTLPKR
jgi:hypothetical protein